MARSVKPRRSAFNFFSQNTQVLRSGEKLEELRASFEERNGFAICLQETGRREAKECLEWKTGFTLLLGGCPSQSSKQKAGVGKRLLESR